MIALFFTLGVVGLLLRWRLGVRRARRLTRAPLAGFDTGTRSPYRTPRTVRFHRGL